jgi:(E)-4-hydroxy-3-methylbut-2-enyl-diphosphate synthase
LNFISQFISIDYLSGTRLVVSVRGDEPYEELEILKDIDATMLLHELPLTEDKISRVHAARR